MKTGYEKYGMTSKEAAFYALLEEIIDRLENIENYLRKTGDISPLG